MSPQTDLFQAQPAHTLARRENPATSKDAAASAVHFVADHHATIVGVLRKHGAKGLTVHEIATYCRLDAHAIGKRVGELERGGAVKVLRKRAADGLPGDEVTRKTPSGRSARVWVLEGGSA